MLTLEPLTDEDIGLLIESRALVDERGLNNTVELDEEARDYLIRMAPRRRTPGIDNSGGRSRVAVDQHVLTTVRLALPSISAQAMDQAVLRYDKDGDQHYDVISAFIKSIRGSDVDAALHYLARMIHARRRPEIYCPASYRSRFGKTSNGRPHSFANRCCRGATVQLIGMPEGRIPLAQAVVHLATAPKSISHMWPLMPL